MVAVLHVAPRTAAPEAVAAWLAALAHDYSADERASFAAAFDYARGRTGDAAMADGEAALDRALGAATILTGLKLDADSIRGALLIGLPVAGAFDAEDVRARFGADVATLVAGVARMGDIRAAAGTGDKDERAAQAGHKDADGLSLEPPGSPIGHEHCLTLQDHPQFSQAIVAQRLAALHQVDNQIGQIDQGRQLHRAR